MGLLVVGSVALDTVETPFGKVRDALGGSAVYFSIGASFFYGVNLVAVVGKDFPRPHINLLRRRKVNVDGLEVKTGETFRWQGRYSYDLSNPETIATHLNVFSSFNPNLPVRYKKNEFVFLANIDPGLQLRVLKQVKGRRFVAADTMNYWIEHEPSKLKKMLRQVNAIIINETEARELSGEWNLIKAIRAVRRLGVSLAIVKKGEHGALLSYRDSIFWSPAYLLESIFDPTGAGDTFAGGFMGYISSAGRLNESVFRRAMVYGSVMASFCVEDFSVNRLVRITRGQVQRRYRELGHLTRF